MSGAPLSPNSPPRAQRCARSPAPGDTAEFPPLVQPAGSASDALPGLPRCSSIPVRWARACPGWSPRLATPGSPSWLRFGDQRRRRLLATAVARSRGPQQRGRAARHRIRPDLGKPASHGLRDEFRRHVVDTDTRRRRGGRTVRAASTAPIVESDIAAVAALALLTDELDGQRIPLTGPQAFTNSELVEVIGAVLGRPLQYREVPAEVVRQRFVDLGFGAEFADAYHAMLAETLDKPAARHSRRREDPWPAGAHVRAVVVRTPRPVHELDRKEPDMSEPQPPRYLKPMNKVMMAVQKLGIPTGPAMVLTVPGRKSGSRVAPR